MPSLTPAPISGRGLAQGDGRQESGDEINKGPVAPVGRNVPLHKWPQEGAVWVERRGT